MYIIFHWILTILNFQQNQISQQVWNICTSNVHNFLLNFHELEHSVIFHRILTTLYIQWIRIFLPIRMIYAYYIHNFPLNFPRCYTFIENIFVNNSGVFVHLMYRIFPWFLMIWYVLRFSIEFYRICTFNEFKFFY